MHNFLKSYLIKAHITSGTVSKLRNPGESGEPFWSLLWSLFLDLESNCLLMARFLERPRLIKTISVHGCVAQSWRNMIVARAQRLAINFSFFFFFFSSKNSRMSKDVTNIFWVKFRDWDFFSLFFLLMNIKSRVKVIVKWSFSIYLQCSLAKKYILAREICDFVSYGRGYKYK